jgi:hypothetical protein
MMLSTCFEPEGSSSGRWLCIQAWYSMVYMHQYKLMHVKHSIPICIYSHPLEDETLDLRRVENIIN